jgi:hypothetical protein
MSKEKIILHTSAFQEKNLKTIPLTNFDRVKLAQ